MNVNEGKRCLSIPEIIIFINKVFYFILNEAASKYTYFHFKIKILHRNTSESEKLTTSNSFKNRMITFVIIRFNSCIIDFIRYSLIFGRTKSKKNFSQKLQLGSAGWRVF